MALAESPTWYPVRPEHLDSGYRSAALRSRVALVGIALPIAFLLYQAFLSVQGYLLMGRIGEAGLIDEARALDAAAATASQLNVVALIVGGITWFAWLTRSVDNAPAIGGGSPDIGPRGSVGWWFVPFANLVMPYRIVADLRRRMAISSADEDTRIVLAWWLTWIGSNAVTSLFFASIVIHTPEDARRYYVGAFVLRLAGAAAGVLLLRIIWVIQRRAEARAAYVAANPEPWATSEEALDDSSETTDAPDEAPFLAPPPPPPPAPA